MTLTAQLRLILTVMTEGDLDALPARDRAELAALLRQWADRASTPQPPRARSGVLGTLADGERAP
jgi:hypothetical protein